MKSRRHEVMIDRMFFLQQVLECEDNMSFDNCQLCFVLQHTTTQQTKTHQHKTRYKNTMKKLILTSSIPPGLPINSFAPHIAVAAFALPPPSPACAGTLFTKSALKYTSFPVRCLINSKARKTKFVESNGTPSILQVNSSASAPEVERVKCSVSPNPTAWKREARSWKLSGRLRRILKKRLILQGLNRVSSVGLASVFDSA